MKTTIGTKYNTSPSDKQGSTLNKAMFLESAWEATPIMLNVSSTRCQFTTKIHTMIPITKNKNTKMHTIMYVYMVQICLSCPLILTLFSLDIRPKNYVVNVFCTSNNLKFVYWRLLQAYIHTSGVSQLQLWGINQSYKEKLNHYIKN